MRFDPAPMAAKLDELLKRPFPRPGLLPFYNPKPIYRALLKNKFVSRARSYLLENQELLENITRHSCVPKEIVVSILLIETGLGENLGGSSAFNRLASMASSSDLEILRPYLPRKLVKKTNEDYARQICRDKSEWAYHELEALLDYARMTGFDPLSLPGSIYGAIGLCQFMPSNIFSYGIDADHDGRIDLFVKDDALSSIANYLQEHGWKCGMDLRSQFRVIFDYNRSAAYVNTVLAVAEKLKPNQAPAGRSAAKEKKAGNKIRSGTL